MKIKALFVTRASAPESPELLTAWDEYSIDDHPSDWVEEQDTALRILDGDWTDKAVIDIVVDEDAIMSILRPRGTVTGTVKEEKQ